MDTQGFIKLKSELEAQGITLVAVSKTHPAEAIKQVYHLGHRVFGENRVQELMDKQALLPADIQWHLIGHLQTNKVRQVVSHVAMIESVDSVKLLKALQKEAALQNIRIDILLEIKIAREPTKYGFDPTTIANDLSTARISEMSSIRFRGVMGMASYVDNLSQIHQEFASLRTVFHQLKQTLFKEHPEFDQISMGMSGDFRAAIDEGSTMVRIGSLIFGARQ